VRRRTPLQVVLDWRAPGLTAGVDEAGRGPLAGPVVAAAVVLDRRGRWRASPTQGAYAAAPRGARDRDPRPRPRLGLGWADAAEVDEFNILQATFLAMRRAC